MSSVIVLAGGTSDERDVSLRSGAAVCAALQERGHSATMLDPALNDFEAACKAAEVVFPALHGAGGEDGTLQDMLERWQTPYVGSGPAASRLCFHKPHFKEQMELHGLQVPAGALVDEAGFTAAELRHKPFVLKPADGGSSVDTLIVRDAADFTGTDLFAHHQTMLLEELVSGTEITVGVLGEDALPVIEIVPPAGMEFDYENKYNGATQELCPPATVSQELQRQAQALAVRAHQLAGCRDLSRSDFIITPKGTIYLLESNTIPGLTDQSLFPRMAAAEGISMPDLCDRLVGMALTRR